MIALVIGIYLVSCKKDDVSQPQNDGLIGKWKLVEIYVDPGGGAKWQKVEQYASSVVEFKADGGFSEKKGEIYSSINQHDTYVLLPDQKIQMSARDSVRFPYKAVWTYSDLTPTSLTLSYECFEACSGRYVSVK